MSSIQTAAAFGQALAVPASPAPTLPKELIYRLRTGCVYETQYDDTYSILVMRYWPRRVRRENIAEWWPFLAPSIELLQARRDTGSPMTWPVFAAHYLAELEASLTTRYRSYVPQLEELLQTHPTVTLLCGEHAPDGDERHVLCHRRLLKAHLFGETPAELQGVELLLDALKEPSTSC